MTQNHKKIKKQLFHYVLGSLPPKRRRKIETHLEECETCRREKESIENLVKGVKSKTGFLLPDYTLEKTKTEMKKEYRKKYGPRGRENERSTPFFPALIRPLIEKIDSTGSIRWIFQPAALMLTAVLVSLIVTGVSLLTQPDQLIAFNFPFSLFRAFDIS